MHEVLQPEAWVRPKGYSNGIKASGAMVFTAGVIGWNAQEKFESDDFVDQFAQAIQNTLEILAEGGAAPEHIVRMTWYVTSKHAYLASLPQIGSIWREKLGRVFPCIACVEVNALVEDQAKIEIETTAVLPVEKD